MVNEYEEENGSQFLADLVSATNYTQDKEVAIDRLRKYEEGLSKKFGARSGYPIPMAFLQGRENYRCLDYPTGFFLRHEVLPVDRDIVSAPSISFEESVAKVTESKAPVNKFYSRVELDDELTRHAGLYSQVLLNALMSTYWNQLNSSILIGGETSGSHKGLVTTARETKAVIDVTSDSPSDIISNLHQQVIQMYRSNHDASPIVIMHPSRWTYLMVGREEEMHKSISTDGVTLLRPYEISPYRSLPGIGVPVVLDPWVSVTEGDEGDGDSIIITDRNVWHLWEEELPIYVYAQRDRSYHSRLLIHGEGRSALVYTGNKNSTVLIEGKGLQIPHQNFSEEVDPQGEQK